MDAPELRLRQPDPPPALMIGIAFAQGIALLALWRAASGNHWPTELPALNFPLWTVAIVWPGLALLSLDATDRGRALALVSAVAAMAAALAVYAGWQASPAGEFPVDALLFDAVTSLAVICFLALLPLQVLAARQKSSYALLFALSWRNFLVAILAILATALFALVLWLWARLFSAIGIDFFADLFGEDWFMFPTLAVAGGVSVLVFRRLAGLVDGIAALLAGLMRLLLPLAVAIVAIFLVALPFTGLAPLWETRNGTWLLLWLNALALFFANAAYQSGAEIRYPKPLHRALGVGMVLLPAISGLAAYGLALRVAQHGWSVDRLWGAAVCAWFGALSLGYAGFVVWRRDAWAQGLGPVNAALGCVAALALILANSPLLDLRSLSLSSQWQRVERGELALEDFDFAYAKEQLARPGWRKTQALIAEYQDADPRLVRVIREASSQRLAQVDWQRLRYRPQPFDVPADARDALEIAVRALPIRNDHQAVAVRADLNRDGRMDYALVFGLGGLVGRNAAGKTAGVLAYADRKGWRTMELVVRQPPPAATGLAATLRSGDVRTVSRPGRDLQIGEMILTPRYAEEPLDLVSGLFGQ